MCTDYCVLVPNEDRPTEIADLDALKALAHPRRQQILQELSLHGPATSAMLARRLELNTGATSYHLRELERFGFVAESERERSGRERWWRAAPRDLRIPPRSEQSEQMRPVVDELSRIAYAADVAMFEQLQRDSDELGEWMDAFPYSRGTIQVTVGELHSFFDEYIELLNRYKRSDDRVPGVRTVQTRLLAFPADPADNDNDSTR